MNKNSVNDASIQKLPNIEAIGSGIGSRGQSLANLNFAPLAPHMR